MIIFQDSADISVAQPGLGRCYLVLTREKSWRGGQFAVFTKNLDFSRLRNEIRMRSLVPRERKNVVEELSTHKFDEHIENRCVLFNPST